MLQRPDRGARRPGRVRRRRRACWRSPRVRPRPDRAPRTPSPPSRPDHHAAEAHDHGHHPPAPCHSRDPGGGRQVRRPRRIRPASSYVKLPKSFIAPGQALFAANCSSCHGPEAARDHPGPQPAGTGGGHGRLLGVHRPDAAGQLQRPGHPQATPVQPAPDPRDRRLGAVAHPGPGGPGAGGQHQRTPTSRRATTSSPSTARPATPSPVPVTP